MANYLRDVRYNPTRLPYRNYRNPTSNFGGQTIIPYSPALLNTALDPCFGCKFTFFIPNGTEIDHFHLSNVGERIMQTPCAMRHVSYNTDLDTLVDINILLKLYLLTASVKFYDLILSHYLLKLCEWCITTYVG